MKEIKRIDIVSVGKIFGIMYIIFGFLAGLFMSIMASFASIPMYPLGLFFGTFSVIVLPVIYGVMGFVGGIITAFLYNIIAEKIGGIKIKI